MRRVGIAPTLLAAIIAGLAACVHRSEHDEILDAMVNPTASELSCPPAGAKVVHGPLMRKLDSVKGDTAFATLMIDCAVQPPPCPAGQTCATPSSNVVRVTTTYLLIRRHGEWRVEKPVAGGIVTGL